MDVLLETSSTGSRYVYVPQDPPRVDYNVKPESGKQHVWGQCWCGRYHAPHGKVENKFLGDVITLDFTKQLRAAGRAVGQGLGVGRIECKCGMLFDSAEAFNKHLRENPER